jgi:hypothetical protein
MAKQKQRVLFGAVRILLQPLVRILIRNGVSYGALAEVAREVYVDVAFREFKPEGRKPTVSRVSALTGLSRKEVKRLHELKVSGAETGQKRYSRAVRVISGWMNDRRFHDDSGKPSILALEGRRKSFELLVKEYSGDIPTMAMLGMLQEAGSIRLKDNRVSLVRRAFIPGDDDTDKIRILGSDVFELISTIDHNLTSEPEELRFQRKVSYDNIDPAALGKLRKLSARKAQTLLEQLDRQFSGHELDDGSSRGESISLGIYFYEQGSSRE